MFNIVLVKLNVVGVWYTYDQIILTGMDWSLCAFHNFSDHLFLIIREPGYWYQQPFSDNKKCQIAVCSSVAYGTHWDPQWQPDTTGAVITPLQQIHIDNRGQPACRSLMGLGWGCPIDCYLNQWWLVYWRIYASLGLNELSRLGNKSWQRSLTQYCVTRGQCVNRLKRLSLMSKHFLTSLWSKAGRHPD